MSCRSVSHVRVATSAVLDDSSMTNETMHALWFRYCTRPQLMHRTTVGWRQHPFECEVRSEAGMTWLLLFEGSQLVFSERVVSLEAAFERAREVASRLSSADAKCA